MTDEIISKGERTGLTEVAIDNNDRLTMPRARAKRPPPSTRCPQCGHADLSALPTFSAGSGVVTRPFAEDVVCHGCGFIGMPALVGS